MERLSLHSQSGLPQYDCSGHNSLYILQDASSYERHRHVYELSIETIANSIFSGSNFTGLAGILDSVRLFT